MNWPATRARLEAGLAVKAYPAVVCQVGRRAAAVDTIAMGSLTYEPGAAECTRNTIFDLASLTKVIATTSLVMQAVRTRRLLIDTRVRDVLPEWRVNGADQVTIGHLLDHSSGLPAHVRVWEHAATADDLRAAVLHVPFERPVGASAVYSDVGFLLLGLLLERLDGDLRSQWQRLWPADLPEMDYLPGPELRAHIAPTEIDPWRGRLLVGEVHDENAARLGGIAPHAGLFAAVDAVGAFARVVLESLRAETWLANPTMMRAFVTPRQTPGSSRALGWDTMRPTSSCGTSMSADAFGHTGFTGTSLWIDPARDLYVVLLTNRVHPTRTNDRFVPMRALIHDAIAADLA